MDKSDEQRPNSSHEDLMDISGSSQYTQTEELVFKLLENPDISIGASPDQSIFDSDTRRNSKSSNAGEHELQARSLKEVLAIIEQLQKICGKVSKKNQISLLCTIGYLREYCLILAEEEKNGGKAPKSVSNETTGSGEDENPEGAKFWLSAYNGDKPSSKERGIKRFKKMAMAVKTAITIAGLSRLSIASNSLTHSLLPVSQSIWEESQQYLLKNLACWDFDQFKFDQVTNNHGISFLFLEIIKGTKLLQDFKIDLIKLAKFCLEIEKGYQLHGNPYHNEIHGADVLQTTFFLVSNLKVISKKTTVYVVVQLSLL